MTAYYTATGNPVKLSRGVSSLERSEFLAIQVGFAAVQADMANKASSGGTVWTGDQDFTGANLTAATRPPGDSSAFVATTAFCAALALSAVLPGQMGNAGKFLVTDGTTASWSATATGVPGGGTGISSYTVGDMLYASATTTLAKLAAVAAGNVLLSGGTGVAPAWGKVNLASAVTGITGSTNGGTGIANDPASTFTITGAYGLTLTLTAATALTAPIAGTLATLDGSETLTAKTLTNPALGDSNLTGVKMVGFTAEYDNGNSGTSKTVVMANGMKQKLTLTANCALTIDWSGALVGNYQLRLIQDATGGWVPTYTAGLSASRWTNATSAPASNLAANGETVITASWNGASAIQSLNKIGAV